MGGIWRWMWGEDYNLRNPCWMVVGAWGRKGKDEPYYSFFFASSRARVASSHQIVVAAGGLII